MSEQGFRPGRPEPFRAVEPKAPPQPPRIPPVPGKEATSHRKKHPIRRRVIAGAVAIGLATGGGVAANTLLNRDHGPIPTPSGPTPTEPTATPTETPQIKIKPTGEVFWGNEPAPLGLLGEPYYIDMTGSTLTYSSGILTKVYEKDVKISDKEESAWFATLNFGEHNGKTIIGDFFLGQDDRKVAVAHMSGPSLPRDPHPNSPAGVSAETLPALDLVKELRDRLGSQLVLNMTIKWDKSKIPNCDQIPSCVYYSQVLSPLLSYNQRLEQQLSEHSSPKNAAATFGLADYIFIPPRTSS